MRKSYYRKSRDYWCWTWGLGCCCGTPLQELSDEQLYDIWHRHTKHCPSCRQSLVLIDKVKDYCQNFTAVLAILALLLILINLPTKIVLIPVLLGILSLICSYKLGSIRERFISSIPKKGLPVVELYEPTQDS